LKILAFNGSPRRHGNTTILLHELLRGAEATGLHTEEIIADSIDLKYCRGCLKCNLIQKCSLTNDDWDALSQKIHDCDVLVFASPIYFHHVTAQLKKIIDRFRSFVHVQITESGLKYTPWHEWRKQIILILSLGSSVEKDTEPVIDLFNFIKHQLGKENKLTSIIGTRLAVTNQVKMTEDELKLLYSKISIPVQLAKEDYLKNQKLLQQCYEIGKNFGIC